MTRPSIGCVLSSCGYVSVASEALQAANRQVMAVVASAVDVSLASETSDFFSNIWMRSVVACPVIFPKLSNDPPL